MKKSNTFSSKMTLPHQIVECVTSSAVFLDNCGEHKVVEFGFSWKSQFSNQHCHIYWVISYLSPCFGNDRDNIWLENFTICCVITPANIPSFFPGIFVGNSNSTVFGIFQMLLPDSESVSHKELGRFSPWFLGA